MRRTLYVLGAAALLLGGCETVNLIAPPVTASAVAEGKRRGATRETLEAGRRLYTTRCTECHVARPILDYPGEEWVGIVDKMAERSGLSAADRRELLGYLLVERELLGASRNMN